MPPLPDEERGDRAARRRRPWPREDRTGVPDLPQDELAAARTATRLLIGPAERRARSGELIAELLTPLARERLLDYWIYEGVAVLAIERAREAGITDPDWDAVQDDFCEQAAQARMVQEAVAMQATRMLEREGIASVVLKGPFMAARIYGDPLLRSPSSDLDLLVARADLFRAAEVIGAAGWQAPRDARVHGALPGLHLSLGGPGDLPAIELHWRVQWYDEDEHTSGLLARRHADGPFALPSDQDLLDVLLLCWARDGLHRARLLADLAAALEATGATLEASHLPDLPALRRVHAETVPAVRALLGLPEPAGIRGPGGGWHLGRRALTRIAAHDQPTSTRGAFAQAALVDLIVSPRGLRRERFGDSWLRHPAAIARWHPELGGGWRTAAARLASLVRTTTRAARILLRRA